MQDGYCATGAARELLLKEFSQWRNENKVSLSLVDDSVCDDGRVCLKLSLGRDKVFSLLCPATYPDYDDNFFAESESVNHWWLNALNEFILDSDRSLTLASILWKADSLDSRVRDSPPNSSDEEDENEEFMVLEEEDEEDQLERQLWEKEKLWRAKEAKLRASMKEAEAVAGLSSGSLVAPDATKKPNQVFSNSAASGILTNDLKHIIKSACETGIDVEPIDNNIYEWSVRFSKFDPESKLQKDLNTLKEAHGIGYIELQLEFTMDLYPFYPPVAKMVRPRPEGSVRFMLACLDILKLSSWNPACGMIVVLEEIKAYLAKHAILHVDTAFRASLLLPIESSLLQLALVSEVLPRDFPCKSSMSTSSSNASTCSSASDSSKKSDPSGTPTMTATATNPVALLAASTPIPPLPSGNNSVPSNFVVTIPTTPVLTGNSAAVIMKKALSLGKATAKKQTFPDGTGYSTFSDKGWDINAHIAVEKEKDKKIEVVLKTILLDLQEYLSKQDCNSNILDGSGILVASDGRSLFNATPAKDNTNHKVSEETGPEKVNEDDSESNSSTASGSCQKNYANSSPTSWDPHHELYEALEASTLIPFIEQKLQVDSFLEICQHKEVYRCVIDILGEIAVRPWLARLLWKQPGQKKSVYSLLLCIKEKAHKVLDRYKIAAQSSLSAKTVEKEKKGKKRANSGSRDKDQATRKSKVTVPSNASSSSDSGVLAGSSGLASTSKSPTKDIFDGMDGELSLDGSEQDTLDGIENLIPPSPPSPAVGALGASASTSTSTFASGLSGAGTFFKLKFKPCNKGDAVKVKATATVIASGSDNSVNDTSSVTGGGLSGFFSNFGLSWPGTWSVLSSDHGPPPLDISTPLDPAGDELLAHDFYDLAVKVEEVINGLGFLGSDSPEHSDEPLEQRLLNGAGSSSGDGSVSLSDSDTADQELSAKYIAALRSLQFDSCDIDVSNTSSHTYVSSFTSALAPGRAQMMRIAQELASLSTSLPLDLASAVFVRSDDAKVTLLKALIIGPEGTPYASGCFLFDIFLPSNYPKSPPKVTLRTTGRNTVRFNPNLYASGKVCLSLLGTWNGLQGEQWNETSTLLQVLVSIQSLIMVSEPYFNEPGYDVAMGTPEGKNASESYNHSIKVNTVRLAMIEMLKYPPADFEDVVRTHFRIKRQRILNEIDNYLLLHPTQSQLAKAHKALKSELAKLKD